MESAKVGRSWSIALAAKSLLIYGEQSDSTKTPPASMPPKLY